jgi:hypothetical protein
LAAGKNRTNLSVEITGRSHQHHIVTPTKSINYQHKNKKKTENMLFGTEKWGRNLEKPHNGLKVMCSYTL